MNRSNQTITYIYRFRRHIDIDDVQDTLTLAVLAAENLHGRSRLRMDGNWRLDRQRRTCVIDGTTEVGQDIARLFTGFVSREFGEKSFQLVRPDPVREQHALDGV